MFEVVIMFSQMIIIKPGTGISANVIISEDIFPVLHRLFVNHGKKFGITFPAYTFDRNVDILSWGGLWLCIFGKGIRRYFVMHISR